MMNSQEWTFYLVIPPGLEKVALSELSYWWPLLPGEKVEKFPEVHRLKGGLEFSTNRQRGLLLNEVLKVPSRILLRIKDFPCTSFEKFSQMVSQVPWGDFFTDPPELKVHVSSRGSALYTAKRIEKSFHQGWEKFWQGHSSVDGPSQGVFVRICDDHVTLSLDSSGEHLHRRGERTHIGVAPLRENLAAGLLWFLCDTGKFNGVGQVTLIDPMAGSGVFALEARQLLKIKEERYYSYQDWIVSKKREPFLSLWQQETFAQYGLYDVDEKMLETTRDNLPIQDQGRFHVHRRDIMTSDTSGAVEGEKNWVIVNPPYGERIKVKGSLTDYYQRLFMNIEKTWCPQRVGVILPRKVSWKKLRLPPSWRYRQSLSFKNGGIDVFFVYWDVSKQ